MRKPYILVVIFIFDIGCARNSFQQVDNNHLLFSQWQYIYASRCPYNPASLAPCYQYSSSNLSAWSRDSSYLKIDTNANVYQNVQGKSGYWSLKDSFTVVRINDSLLHISPSNAHPATSIKIRALTDHLLVLEYIADLYGNSFGLDSLAK